MMLWVHYTCFTQNCLQRGSGRGGNDRDGDPRRLGKGGTVSLPRCHYQNDSCINNKIGSNENHFNVSFIAGGKVTKTVLVKWNFWRERRAKADNWTSIIRYQPNTIPLGHSGSHLNDRWVNRMPLFFSPYKVKLKGDTNQQGIRGPVSKYSAVKYTCCSFSVNLWSSFVDKLC